MSENQVSADAGQGFEPVALFEIGKHYRQRNGTVVQLCVWRNGNPIGHGWVQCGTTGFGDGFRSLHDGMDSAGYEERSLIPGALVCSKDTGMWLPELSQGSTTVPAPDALEEEDVKAGWCRECGCGHEGYGYAHLKTCRAPAVAASANARMIERDEKALEGAIRCAASRMGEKEFARSLVTAKPPLASLTLLGDSSNPRHGSSFLLGK